MTPKLGDRSLFPTLEARAYLNHAAVSPLSAPVRAAAIAALDDLARLGTGAIGPWMHRREALRGEVAAFLGVDPAGVGFPPGTTRGIVDLALAIDWRPGDRLLTFDGEFPANVTPWETAARRFGATPERLPLDGFGDGSGRGEQRVEDALRRGGVRLVAVSAVQFTTGLRMPLRTLGALARRHGAELFVDGIQAVGGTPVDLSEVDGLVTGTHKWLMGMDGLGVAWVSPAARERLRPLTAGWLAAEDPIAFLMGEPGHLSYDKPLRRSLDWMEGGVQTTAAFAALQASLGLLAAIGVDRIAAHVQEWHDAIEPRLQALGLTSARAADPAARSNTLSLRPPPGVSAGALAAALRERGVLVSTPDGWVRLSPHWPNARAEVDLVAEAFREALGG